MSLFISRISYNSIKHRGVLFILKRYKSKLQKKEQNNPCVKALKHFDDFYKAVFGERWPSVRLALLTKQKYFAVINNFGDTLNTEENLKNQGAFNLKEFLEVQKNFVEDFKAKKKNKKNEKTELKDIIQQHLLQEEEKEMQLLHPEGVNFMTKVDNCRMQESHENDESEETYKHNYRPEDARTSLESDLKMSEIDKNRLIMPGSLTDAAMLHEFIPATQLRGVEEYIPESDYYKYYKVKSSVLLDFEEEHEISFPENLKVYTFDRGETLDFLDPTKCCNNVYDYLKIDGGDLLATLALDVQPGDTVLDMCSISQNISYCIFQTLRSKLLVCAADKNGKTQNFFDEYLHYDEYSPNVNLSIISNPLNEDEYQGFFNKVLVNVPSTCDKTALFEVTGNMFHIKKLKERLKLPETQCSLLVRAMKLVRPGGTVIYTTSTLSPVQNDGVVNEALKTIWEENKLKFTVKKLSPALQHMSLFFNFGDFLNLKFGILVVPFVPANFGPTFICKIVKNPVEENVTV